MGRDVYTLFLKAENLRESQNKLQREKKGKGSAGIKGANLSHCSTVTSDENGQLNFFLVSRDAYQSKKMRFSFVQPHGVYPKGQG